MVFCAKSVFFLFLSLSLALPFSKEQQYTSEVGWMNGCSIGGWLVMEPTWMYDQFSAATENDFVASLRASGDDYAIQTMKNHWGGYIPDSALDTIQEFGITHVRLPVGYWIADVPVNQDNATMYDFGFNDEGFVTGGLNYLEAMIAKLKQRNIRAIVDLHAVPGAGSNCQSYAGVMEANSANSFWLGKPWSSPHDSECGLGGPYTTSRSSELTWMEIGENTMIFLATWVVKLQSSPSMSDTVVGLEMVNEPGLGWLSMQTYIQNYHSDIIPRVQVILSNAGLNDVVIETNFIGPNDNGMGAWLKEQEGSTFSPSPPINVDYHNYYNWDGPETWQSLAAQICGGSGASPWAQYVDNDQSVWIGEWSDASNLDSPTYTNFSDPTIAANLATLHANQMSLYYTSPNLIGQFYWSLRLGSGWAPWPTDDCPNGCQIAGTSASQSLVTFQYRVWNFLEIIANKIALPLSEYNITGLCECNGCNSNVPFSWIPGSHCMYAEGCDFPGVGDIGSALVDNYLCSDACFNTSGCTNFAWTESQGGTCFFKSGALEPYQASSTNQPGALCGIMSYTGNWTSSGYYLVGFGCDFIANDIAEEPGAQYEDCETFCTNLDGCTNFVFAKGGCYLKTGDLTWNEAIVNGDGYVCGIGVGA